MNQLNISDEYLVEAYINALRLKLTPDFIYLLETEIIARGLVHADYLFLQTHLIGAGD
ncbi:sporulation histidine kinase inhibitor Sda [Domibacillus robiginosus]|uniref:sporulation histidine kinase inhibitor Sda n=1 Tax=Domibacillus robiginosus TaxID=1071054 RepID=UPI0009E53427|nr:sporulation histidine kinase inhibitor Sda [Domibacillus robiginosus]